MEDDSSNDNSVVAITSDEDEDSPIKRLFKRLINNDCKQHTVLTNNQILELLKVEFDMNIYQLHSLEIDIYVMLIKKYIKDWPLWEEFDILVNNSKQEKNLTNFDEVLQSKYSHLKTYLMSILNVAIPLARQKVKQVKSSKQIKNADKESAVQDVVMEIASTRNQLNTMFLRYPTATSVFSENDPKTVIVDEGLRNLDAILNWWNISIEILKKNEKGSNSTLYKREIKYELKHTLVNKVLPDKDSPDAVHLNQQLLFSDRKKSTVFEKSLFMSFIDEVAQLYSEQEANEVIKFIQKDMHFMPPTLQTLICYKRYLSAYPYVRYLYKECEKTEENPKFDLQLEEIHSPVYRLFIGDLTDMVVTPELVSIRIECTSCRVVFSGATIIADLREHFERHCAEADWTCTGCKCSFPMLHLASQWWGHICSKDTETSDN